jgi:recombination protein RecA
MARTAAKEIALGTNSERQQKFADALKAVNGLGGMLKSETGQNIIAKLSDRPMDVKTISSGSLVLDSILGGGFGVGRLHEIYGPEASGKTSIALTVAANVQRTGGNAAFIDLEHALDPAYAKKLGVDVANLAVAQPEHAEQALELVEQLAQTKLVDLIIVDSIAALVPKLELEGDMEQGSIGLVARLLSRSLKKLVGTAHRTGTTIIFINQVRDQIGGFSPVGTPQTTTGGKAMKFYASQRVDVRKRDQVKEGKEVIGTLVKLKIIKNKIAPPFGEGFTVLTFNHGINRPAEMIEVGPTFGVIERPNNRTYVEAATGEIIAKSKADAVKRLQDDTEMFERLAAALSATLSEDLQNSKEKSEEISITEDELEEDEEV